MAQDISGQRQLGEAARLEDFFELSADPMCMASLSGFFLQVNTAFTTVLGYTREELLATSFLELVHPDDIASTKEELNKLEQGQTTFDFENRYRCKDGAWRWLSWRSRVVPSGCIVAVARDVTDEKNRVMLMEQVLNAAPAAMLLVDDSGIICTSNRYSDELFGYRPGELVGESVDMLVPEEHRGQHKMFRSMFIADPSTRAMGQGRALRAVRKDGVTIPVEIGIGPFENDTIKGVVLTVSDLHEREEYEQRLLEYERIVSQMPVGVLLGHFLDLDDPGSFHIDAVNPAGRSAMAFEGDFTGKTIRERFPSLLESGVAQTCLRAVKTNEIIDLGHIRYGDQGAREEIFDTKAVPIGNGKVALVYQYVTELVLYSERLEQRERDLSRSNRDLEHFAYAVSHDLREPLRMILSFTELLLESFDQELDPTQQRFYGFITEGGERMNELMTGLLEYSRVGRKKNELKPIDLKDVLLGARANLGVLIEETSATITHEGLGVVVGDAMQLMQVFQNLLSNAIKFRRDDAAPEIHVLGEVLDDEQVRVHVRDNGIGIDPKHIARIFQIFQRLHRREDYPGNGVGLALVQRIVERHGSRVEVDSVPGGGATFSFELQRSLS
ncbi:MAG: PAS domain S-box protein [Myxococcota bacterium]